MRLIKNDLSPQTSFTPSSSFKLDNCQPSTSKLPSDFYGLSLQQTKETFYKDIPSSSKNYNVDNDTKYKCLKTENSPYLSTLDSLNLQSKDASKSKNKRNDLLNNGSRRYSDSSAQKSNIAQTSRFTTTLVSEDFLRPGTSSTSSNNAEVSVNDQVVPSITKANNTNVKPGFRIAES